jgi:hypothetical protein
MTNPELDYLRSKIRVATELDDNTIAVPVSVARVIVGRLECASAPSAADTGSVAPSNEGASPSTVGAVARSYDSPGRAYAEHNRLAVTKEWVSGWDAAAEHYRKALCDIETCVTACDGDFEGATNIIAERAHNAAWPELSTPTVEPRS